jgi:acetyl-CoA acetyltransferase
MKFLQEREIAIVSYGEAVNAKSSGRSALELSAQVAEQALMRVGMDISDVDGLAVCTPLSEAGDPFWSNVVAETLGLMVTWLHSTDLGGAGAVSSVAQAAAAIVTGQCEVVLCVFADAPSTRYLGRQGGHRTEFADPAGWAGPTTGFGMLATLYAQRYGWPEEAIGRLLVQQRRNALAHSNADVSLRKPLTVEQYRSSRPIADPLRMLDCVMRTDGANAVLVTSKKRAVSLGLHHWASPVAYREVTNPDPTHAGDDLLVSGFSRIGPLALADAGWVPDDIRMAQLYDDFSIAVLFQLEELGVCERGGAGAWLMREDFSPAGRLPLNTGGGQLSMGQCGLAGGGIGVVEAVRQLLEDAGPRQVPDPRNALVTGLGVLPYAGNWGTSAVLLLEQRTS